MKQTQDEKEEQLDAFKRSVAQFESELKKEDESIQRLASDYGVEDDEDEDEEELSYSVDSSRSKRGRDDDTDLNPTKRKKKKTLSLPYEVYKKIAMLILDYLRDGADIKDEDESGGCSRKSVVNWYITTHMPSATEREARKQARVLNKIIDKMIHSDDVLVELTDKKNGGKDDTLLMVHPNYQGRL